MHTLGIGGEDNTKNFIPFLSYWKNRISTIINFFKNINAIIIDEIQWLEIN